jgi:hypothetical protein
MDSVKIPTPCKNSRDIYGMVIDAGSPRISLSTPSADELCKTTQEKIDEIKDHGYDVKQMWECDWERLKKQNLELKAFVKDMVLWKSIFTSQMI